MHTLVSQRRSSGSVHLDGSAGVNMRERKRIIGGEVPPVGSSCAGNISLPHIDHAATAVTIPVKAKRLATVH